MILLVLDSASHCQLPRVSFQLIGESYSSIGRQRDGYLLYHAEPSPAGFEDQVFHERATKSVAIHWMQV